jgi:hypothetical protein
MLEKAARLCDANFANIFRWDGEALHLIAIRNTPPAFAEYRQRRPLPLKPSALGHASERSGRLAS